VKRQQKRPGGKPSAKPAAFDNSWRGNTVTRARIQEIDYSVDRKTLGECLDTPNALAKELQDPKYRGHDVWIRDAFGTAAITAMWANVHVEVLETLWALPRFFRSQSLRRR
jgi:hypothetical protein